MLINNATHEKSFGSFQNTGTDTGDPNDILINHTCWTMVNKDWAILQWTLLSSTTPLYKLNLTSRKTFPYC